MQEFQHACSRPGCKQRADCIPVLVVPAHPLSGNPKYEGVRNVLWLPLCRPHFNATNVREFLTGEVIAGMQGSIEAEFRANQAVGDWNKAAIQMLGKNSKEFRHYEQIYLAARAGAPIAGKLN